MHNGNLRDLWEYYGYLTDPLQIVITHINFKIQTRASVFQLQVGIHSVWTLDFGLWT